MALLIGSENSERIATAHQIGGDGDTVRALGGNDTIFPSQGTNEVYDGGEGRDQVNFQGAPGSLTADLAAGTGQVAAENWGANTLIGIEDLIGSGANDTLLGDDAAHGNAINGL